MVGGACGVAGLIARIQRRAALELGNAISQSQLVLEPLVSGQALRVIGVQVRVHPSASVLS